MDEIPNISGATNGFSQDNQWGFSDNNGTGGVATINNYTYRAASLDRLTGFNGTVTPITAIINGVPQSTGDITVNLDSNLESTLEIVRENLVYSVKENLNLIINSPFMASLGLENLPINIIETGISPDGMNFDLAGGGVVGGLSPFAGATYFSARNHYEHQPLIIIGKDHYRGRMAMGFWINSNSPITRSAWQYTTSRNSGGHNGSERCSRAVYTFFIGHWSCITKMAGIIGGRVELNVQLNSTQRSGKLRFASELCYILM